MLPTLFEAPTLEISELLEASLEFPKRSTSPNVMFPRNRFALTHDD